MSLVRLFDTLAPDSSWVRNPFSIFGTAVAADAWLASDTSAFANTYIESRETAGAYVFSAALPPGVKKEEVRVEVDEGNVLVITGERSVRREERRDRWHHIERSCATFLGRFHLPEDAAVDGVRPPWTPARSPSPCPRSGRPPSPTRRRRPRRRRWPSRPACADPTPTGAAALLVNEQWRATSCDSEVARPYRLKSEPSSRPLLWFGLAYFSL
ncbi:unnamed protein product [Urochloa humidicola]